MLDVKVLLMKICEQFKSSSWTNITLASGYTNKGKTAYRKTGNIVEVSFNIASSAAHTSYAICTQNALPSNCRPDADVNISCQGNTTAMASAYIGTDGHIYFYLSTSSSAWFRGRAIYIVS